MGRHPSRSRTFGRYGGPSDGRCWGDMDRDRYGEDRERFLEVRDERSAR